VICALAGRMADLSQVALGAVVLRPLFRRMRASRPPLWERMRHEPFAARGETFVREVGWLEKVAFVAKMLGTDGDLAGEAAVCDPDPAGGDGPEVLFAGDVLSPGAFAVRSFSARLRARIARAHAFVVNLEGTVGERSHEIAPFLTKQGLRQLLDYEQDPVNQDWTSRFDAGSLRTLRALSPRAVVSVANNHTLDDGPEGFARTVNAARALGISVIGDARGGTGATLLEVDARRIGLFAIAYGTNRFGPASPEHLRFDGVPYRLSLARMKSLTQALRDSGATHIVAILHWGYEHEHRPAPEQRSCADVLFEAGVSAIVGHHPHLLQTSGSREGRWVSYSLGDFVGGDRTVWSRIAGMLSLRFGSAGRVTGKVVPVVQTPFWAPQRTMLLDEAPLLERKVFERFFAQKLSSRIDP
jgi:hypothetical protein